MWNSVYFTIQVMTSVGYGDYYPQTLFGKVFTILAAGTGQLLLALAIVAVGYLSNFTPLERKAYDNVQHDTAQQKKILLSVRWIQTAYRYRLYMKMNHHPQKFKQLIYINEMRECARNFQKHRFKMF